MLSPDERQQAPQCGACRGLAWLYVENGDGVQGGIEPCSSCATATYRDFFADLTVLPGNAQAIALARDFVVRPTGWLMLVGALGTGKSWLLSAITSQLCGAQRQALTAAEMLDIWRGAMDKDDFLPTFQAFCTSPAIVLDDLGAERTTDWTLERLTMFLDYRYGRALPTALATNYDRPGLEARLGGRIADRVFDQGTGLVRIAHLDVRSFRLVPGGNNQ